MPRPRRRRSRRSAYLPALALFGLGLGCIVCAGFLWLFAPDAASGRNAEPARAAVPAHPRAMLAAAKPEPTPPEELATLMPIGTPVPTDSPSPAAVPPPTSTPAPGDTPTPRPARRAAVDGHPRLAIIIDDCGQWIDTERGFVALPFPVTLSVLPHVRYGPTIAHEASLAGKGVMLHLPMETMSGRYPGPGTITTAMGDDAIRSAVAGDLAELPEARGVNNHEGSRATADARVMNDVADVLQRDGVFFVDSKTSAASVAAAVAQAHGIPSASRDVFLDNVDDVAAVEAQLREAAERARTSGAAIAIGHPRPATLAAVRALAPALRADGIDLALAGDLVR